MLKRTISMIIDKCLDPNKKTKKEIKTKNVPKYFSFDSTHIELSKKGTNPIISKN